MLGAATERDVGSARRRNPTMGHGGPASLAYTPRAARAGGGGGAAVPQRKNWRKTTEIPEGWTTPGRAAQPARPRPDPALVYCRSPRAAGVGPPLRRRLDPPRALTERGEPATEPAPSTEHLRNEPIYVSQLRNPMWKSSKAAAQRERVAAAEQAAAEVRAPAPSLPRAADSRAAP